VFRTTEKGRDFLSYYSHLTELLEEGKHLQEVELSSPYFGTMNWMR
jgi:hypothetical protein